jgi:hypothetical protein
MEAATAEVKNPERGHRIRVLIAALSSACTILALTLYGADYYLLDIAERPHSPKHALLRPSGSIGINLGLLGLCLFLGIYLYYFRKRWKWLSRIGNSRHWLDFHIVMGLTAPLVIGFHASFKFNGLAGMAFLIMTAVALSGVTGRYLYAQIPRSLNAAELTWQELESDRARMAEVLANQDMFSPDVLCRALNMPSPAQVAGMSLPNALGIMLLLDLSRPFRVAALRRSVLTFSSYLSTLGGFLRTPSQEAEWVVDLVRKQSTITKKMLFLTRSHEVFHLWHVVHRPFSYAFVVLAGLHIAAVLLLGYF